MREYLKFYIDGQWVDPVQLKTLDVENPATEQVAGKIAVGSAADVDKAVKAARRAFDSFSRTSREERIDLLQRILAEYQKRFGDLATAVTEEMGAPSSLASGPQVALGRRSPGERHRRAQELSVRGTARSDAGGQGADRRLWPDHTVELADQPDRLQGVPGAGHRLHHGPETVGSCAVLRPDIHRDPARRGCSGRRVQPAQGNGPGVGVALSCHPDVDMISFTGSTRPGVDIARNAAPTVKRVSQELGGKSPKIILDDAAFAKNVAGGVMPA